MSNVHAGIAVLVVVFVVCLALFISTVTADQRRRERYLNTQPRKETDHADD